MGCIDLASELANQIASRTDVLAEQLSRGQSRAQLALSDLLKGTGPTDFLRLPDGYQYQRYASVAATEEARRLALAELQADETAAKAPFDSAAGKRRAGWATLTAEARRA